MGAQLEKTKTQLDERADYSKIKTPKGRKETEMPESNVAPKSKKYSKTRGEHFKDIVIAVLITAIVAFIAGANYASKQQAAIDKAVAEVSKPVQAEASAKK